tara:strand:- start:1023 stop:1676 length:654 start_codon:yes stop_codon:yes gene_type:complete
VSETAHFLERYYDHSSDQFNNHIESVGWRSKQQQELRFKILLDHIKYPIESLSLLDVGCGLGDLYDYLCREKKQCHYQGIDISSKLIQAANTAYPKGQFKQLALEQLPKTPQYDIIIASGTFSIADPKSPKMETLMAILQHLYQRCKVTLAFNLLDIKAKPSDKPTRYLRYFEPEKVHKYCQTLCPESELVTGYLDNDFSIIMHKASNTYPMASKTA